MKKINKDLVITDDNINLYKNRIFDYNFILNDASNSIRNTYSLFTFCLGMICFYAINPILIITSPIPILLFCLIISVTTGILVKKLYKANIKKNQKLLMDKIDEYERTKGTLDSVNTSTKNEINEIKLDDKSSNKEIINSQVEILESKDKIFEVNSENEKSVNVKKLEYSIKNDNER